MLPDAGSYPCSGCRRSKGIRATKESSRSPEQIVFEAPRSRVMGQIINRKVKRGVGVSLFAALGFLALAAPLHAGLMTGESFRPDASFPASNVDLSTDLVNSAAGPAAILHAAEEDRVSQPAVVNLRQNSITKLSRQPAGASSSGRAGTPSRSTGGWANVPTALVSRSESCFCYRIETAGGRLPLPLERCLLDPPRLNAI